MMQQPLQALLDKLLNGELTEKEKQQLIGLLDESSKAEEFAQLIDQQLQANTYELPGELPATERQFISNVLAKSGSRQATEPVLDLTETPVVHRVHFMRRWGWAAASVFVLLVAGIWLYTTKNDSKTPVATIDKTTIPPGKEGAVLTLADGSTVLLDNMKNGVVASQNGSAVVLNNGQLSYDVNKQSTGALTYNTMSTPRGRHFQVILPDGSNVWLNAASSIRYPTTFTGNQRKVFVSGEAYFEVAKNEKMPFVVDLINKETVEVLGTEFNVSAYENEAMIKTTLISGAVRVASTILKPGQQAALSTTDSPTRLKLIDKVDIDQVLAWKEGKFNFNGIPLQEAMKQLERWYDIEVVFENGIPAIQLGGKLTKDVDLNGLLKALKNSELTFKQEGRKLIIINQ